MASITLRSVKGSALTNAEVDANFTNINTELGQKLIASDLSSYLPSATAASTYLALAGGTLTGGLAFSGSGLRLTGDFSTSTLANRLAFQTSTVNGNTGVFFLPNGTAQISTVRTYNTSDPTNGSFLQIQANTTNAGITSSASGSGTALPLSLSIGSTEVARLSLGGNLLVGTSTDNGVDKFQVAGSASFTGDLSVTSTGAVRVSSGTTAQRPATPANGMLRYNSSTSQFEGYAAGAWGAIAGSGGGGGTVGQILETAATITSNYTIQAGNNGFSVGPVTIQSGVSVTVPAGRTWLVAQTTTPSGISSGRAVAMAIVFGA